MTSLKIGLAAVRLQGSIAAGVEKIAEVLHQAQEEQVDIVCFPETYLPGLRGIGLDLPAPDQSANERALHTVQRLCEQSSTAAIVGMEWLSDRGLHNRAYVVSAEGTVLGYQTKNQITPGGEADNYVADGERATFAVNGVPFGVVICHEGWRYPETVRWAARRGAQLVFQPQWTGRDDRGRSLTTWGTTFYEKAMECRAQENSVYFASVNVAMNHQNSATSLLDPRGSLIDHVPYGDEQLLAADLDPSEATRFYAERFDADLYPH